MRKNPKRAAQVATPLGAGPEAGHRRGRHGVQHPTADRRLSANNYRALWSAQDRLHRLGFLKSTFDVNKHIEPKHILKVMADHPGLFSDLPLIPAAAQIKPGFVFKP